MEISELEQVKVKHQENPRKTLIYAVRMMKEHVGAASADSLNSLCMHLWEKDSGFLQHHSEQLYRIFVNVKERNPQLAPTSCSSIIHKSLFGIHAVSASLFLSSNNLGIWEEPPKPQQQQHQQWIEWIPVSPPRSNWNAYSLIKKPNIRTTLAKPLHGNCSKNYFKNSKRTN